MSLPDVSPGIRRFGQSAAPLDVVDRIAYVILPVAMLLAQGAAVTSVGLALATWSRRVGRAVAISVAAYVLVAFLSPILLEILPVVLIDSGLFGVSDGPTVEFIVELVVHDLPARWASSSPSRPPSGRPCRVEGRSTSVRSSCC